MRDPSLGVVLLLAAAAYRTTVLVVKDYVPFGAVREAIWRRFPYADQPDTPAPPAPRGKKRAEPIPGKKATKVGYLFTCQWCAGVWNAAAWWVAWLVWPSLTLRVAVLWAVAAIQGTWAAVVDRLEASADDEE